MKYIKAKILRHQSHFPSETPARHTAGTQVSTAFPKRFSSPCLPSPPGSAKLRAGVTHLGGTNRVCELGFGCIWVPGARLEQGSSWDSAVAVNTCRDGAQRLQPGSAQWHPAGTTQDRTVTSRKLLLTLQGSRHCPRRCCSLHPQGYSIPVLDKLQGTRLGTAGGQGDLQRSPPTSATAPTQQSQKWARQLKNTKEVISVFCFWTGNRGCPWRTAKSASLPPAQWKCPQCYGELTAPLARLLVLFIVLPCLLFLMNPAMHKVFKLP